MPSLVEKMQPWTQTHSFIPPLLLRRSWSSSSSNGTTTPLATSSSTASLISSSGAGGGGGSNTMGTSISSSELKSSSSNNGDSINKSSTRGPSSSSSTTTANSIFNKLCHGSKSSGGSSGASSTGSSNSSSGNNNVGTSNHNGGPSRPKRKTPILSACMSNWVKFDHDCQKPLPCAQCERHRVQQEQHNNSNPNSKSKVLFSSPDNVLIGTGSKAKQQHLHHRHSFFGGGGIIGINSNSHHTHHHSEPSSPLDCNSSIVVGNSAIVTGVSSSSHNNSSGGSCSSSSSASSSANPNNAFPGEVVSWENEKNTNSIKIVINLPCRDMNLFQNENIQVEFVCNKNKLSSGKDFQTVQRTRQELKTSGWYWGGIDSEASMEILESAQPGAFIVRDSSDPRFLYSLSIQTERGPTSVRLPYRNGKFSLDGDEKIADRVPKFDSVIALIEHYVNGGTKIGKKVSVWIDHEGNMHSTVKLTKPVRREVGSLKHLARVALNKQNPTVNNNNSSKTLADASVIPSAANSHIPCSSTSSSTKDSLNSVPKSKSENQITSITSTSSSSSNNASVVLLPPPVADLSKLPTSLQNYMMEYPYQL